MRQVRVILGALIWTAVLAWAGYRVFPTWFGNQSAAGKSLTTFAFQQPEVRELKFKYKSVIRIGDPIYLRNQDGRLVQIGALRQVGSPESTDYAPVFCDWASATFFSSAPPLRPADYLTYHQTPSSMDWVARFLFPPERRERIARLVADVYALHSDEIIIELMPIWQNVWAEVSILIRDELLVSLERHRSEFERLGTKYRIEIVDAELIPLLGEEIWPIVLKHGQPVMERVGQQIWQRASVFRFGWRAIYDASPLPQKNLTQAEFTRFVEGEAVPILTRNVSEFMHAQQLILEEIVANPHVQQVATESLRKLGEDPELQRLILQVMRESILENAKVHEVLMKVMERDDVQQVLSLTDSRLEPTVIAIGEEVFGSPYTGVTPEFARILRNKILLKDERWLVLNQTDPTTSRDPWLTENTDPTTLGVVWGDSDMDNPFYYPARKR